MTYFYFRCQDPSRDERDPRAVVDVAVPLEVARTNDATQICSKPHVSDGLEEGAVLCCVVLCCVVLRCVVLCCVVLCCVSCCVVLCCVVLC